MIGRTISHYKILEKLGEGGMGVVYKAEDTTLKRLDALKFISATALGDDQRRHRFLHEAQAAAALDHPNICTVHEIAEADGHTFIVMALVEGQSLKDRIAAGPLDLDFCLEVAVQVAEGLQAAHAKGIVHRDIKPSNLMVTSTGQVKILDFGVAKSADLTKITREGATLGTLAYMSPEQASSTEIDHRTDIWSLGVVLYQMVTGRLPFDAERAPAVLFGILNKEPESITRFRSGVPVELDRIVNKALAKNPANRYQHVDDLLVDLKNLRTSIEAETVSARGFPVAPARVDQLPSARRKSIRKRLALAISVVAAVVLIGLLSPYIRDFLGSPHSQGGKPRIAVLFFDNFGPNSDDDYLAAGVTEDIITSLSHISQLGVLSRSAVERYRGKQIDPRQVREDLGAGYLLEGSIRRVNEVLRVTAQLIETETGTHLWADHFDGTLDDIFAAQDTIAMKVAATLGIAPTLEEQPLVGTHWTDNAQAYAYFLVGREKYWGGRQSPNECTEARDWFEKALAVDPEYAPALAGLSQTYSAERGHVGRLTPGGLKLALELARRAQQLDPNLALAWRAEGFALEQMHHYESAKEALGYAIEVNPGQSELYLRLGWQVYLQDREKAIELMRQGIESDPYNWTNYQACASSSMYHGLYEEAETIITEGLSRLPNHPRILCARADWLREQKRYGEAIKLFRRITDVHPDHYYVHQRLGNALRGARMFAEADSVFQMLLDGWPNNPAVQWHAGRHFYHRREYTKAEELLRRAIDSDEHLYWARRDLALCLSGLGRKDEAESMILGMVRRWPGDADTHVEVAKFYKDELRDYGEAETWAKRAVELAPEWQYTHNTLGLIYGYRSKYEQALEVFEHAVDRWPFAHWNHSNVAWILRELGRLSEAIEAAERSIEIRPHGWGYFQLASAAGRAGKRHQAIVAYEELLELNVGPYDPERSLALNNLAWLYFQEGRFGKQLELLYRAAELDTTVAYPWRSIASLALLDRRDLKLSRDAAMTALRKARTSRDSASAYGQIGRVEELHGHRQAADEFYARGILAIEKELQLTPDETSVLLIAGSLYARGHEDERARACVKRAEDTFFESPDRLYAAARIMTILGDRERAIEYLQMAVEVGFENKALMERDPDLDSIREDSRFQELLDAIR